MKNHENSLILIKAMETSMKTAQKTWFRSESEQITALPGLSHGETPVVDARPASRAWLEALLGDVTSRQ